MERNFSLKNLFKMEANDTFHGSKYKKVSLALCNVKNKNQVSLPLHGSKCGKCNFRWLKSRKLVGKCA